MLHFFTNTYHRFLRTLFIISMLGVPAITFAQQSQSPGNNPPGSGGLTNPLSSSTIDQLMDKILGWVVLVGGVFVVLMLVFTGFKFVEAQGNSEKLQSARQSLYWTVLGALILLGAFTLKDVITATVSAL